MIAGGRRGARRRRCVATTKNKRRANERDAFLQHAHLNLNLNLNLRIATHLVNMHLLLRKQRSMLLSRCARARAPQQHPLPRAFSSSSSASAAAPPSASARRREQEETIRRLAKELPDIARVR